MSAPVGYTPGRGGSTWSTLAAINDTAASSLTAYSSTNTDTRYQRILTGLVPDNGVTDNYAALMSQLNALAAAGGGVARLPSSNGYYGVSQDVILPLGVGLVGHRPHGMKNIGQAIPAAGLVYGSNLGPAVGATITRAVIRLENKSTRIENLGVFGQGGPETGNLVAPRAVENRAGLGSRIKSCLIWGGKIASLDFGAMAGQGGDDSTVEDNLIQQLSNGPNGQGITQVNGCVTTAAWTTVTVPSTAGLSRYMAVQSQDGTVPVGTWIASVVDSTHITLSVAPAFAATLTLFVNPLRYFVPGCVLTNNSSQVLLPDSSLNSILFTDMSLCTGFSGMPGSARLTALTATGSAVATTTAAASGTVTAVAVNPATSGPLPPGRYILTDGTHSDQVTVPKVQSLAALSAALTSGATVTSLPVTALAAAVGAGGVTLTQTISGTSYTQTFTTTGAAAGATSLPVTSAAVNAAYTSGATVTSAGVLSGAGAVTVASVVLGSSYASGATLKSPDNAVTMSAVATANSSTVTVEFLAGFTLRMLSGADSMVRSTRTFWGPVLTTAADITYDQDHFSCEVITDAAQGAYFTGCVWDTGYPLEALVRRDGGAVHITGTRIANANTNPDVNTPGNPTGFPQFLDNGSDGLGFHIANLGIPKVGSDGFSALIKFGSGSSPSASTVSQVAAAAGSWQTGTAPPYIGGSPAVSRGVSVAGVMLAEVPSTAGTTPLTGVQVISSTGVTTTSTTAVMAGLTASITPTLTGKLLVRVYCQPAIQTANGIVTVQGRWGTGTAPTAGAATTGTQFTQGTVSVRPAITATASGQVTLLEKITGSVGTPIWIDLAYLTSASANAASFTGSFVVEYIEVA